MDRHTAISRYDWGGGVALAMAASGRHRRRVERVVAMHPAYGAAAAAAAGGRGAASGAAAMLREVRCGVLVCWAEDNAFHPWSKCTPSDPPLRTTVTFTSHDKEKGRRSSKGHQNAITTKSVLPLRFRRVFERVSNLGGHMTLTFLSN